MSDMGQEFQAGGWIYSRHPSFQAVALLFDLLFYLISVDHIHFADG